MNIERVYAEKRVLPAFMRNRVERFYENRVGKEWGMRALTWGKRPQTDAVLVNHNDYLQLARHPLVLKAQRTCLEDEGNGPMMSSVFFNGPNPVWELESAFADFLGSQDAVLTQSGYAANQGLLQVLTGRDVPVYIDRIAHMSLWVGARLGGARIVPCKHNDVEDFERQMLRYGPGVVVVDSVYSTDGTVSPLESICRLGKEQGCITIVDESHSLGTHGPEGRGMVRELGLGDYVDFITASLAKAFAGRAGIISCDTRFKGYFISHSLPNIFSSATTPHDAAGLLATMEVIRGADFQRARLRRVADTLRAGLQDSGLDLSQSRSQIMSLNFHSEGEMLDVRDELEQKGIFTAPFAAPATPRKRPCLRISAHAGLVPSQVSRIIQAASESAHTRSPLSKDQAIAAWG